MSGTLALDVAHVLAGGLVLVSFMMLYQDRLSALLNIFALHALVLAASVGWQAEVQGAPHLFLTAGIAFLFKAVAIPSGGQHEITFAYVPEHFSLALGLAFAGVLGLLGGGGWLWFGTGNKRPVLAQAVSSQFDRKSFSLPFHSRSLPARAGLPLD